MKVTELLPEVGDKPVAFYPELAKALKNIDDTVFLCQLIYWQGKQKRRDGWIWKSHAEWTEETGLTRRQQDGVRKRLIALGLIETKLKGVPPTLHYKLNIEALKQWWSDYLASRPIAQNGAFEEGSNCTRPRRRKTQTVQSIPENTQRENHWKKRLPESAFAPDEYDDALSGASRQFGYQ